MPRIPIDERVLNSLCTRLSSYRVPVSPINLENMRVIKRLEDQYVATNAYVLLTSNHFLHTEVQCVCCRGTGKTVILDSYDSKCDIVTQTVEALSFVLRHINVASKINGFVRKDVYEVPEVALREAIVNAIVHREYAMQDSSISIEIYGDRIDIGSPGLPLGLDIYQPELGRSKTTDLSRWTVEHALAVLIDKGLVKRVGSNRYGRWVVS